MNPPRRGTPDFLLLFLTFALVCFGLAMVFSASSMTSAYRWDDPWYFTKKQLMAVGLGSVGMLFCMNLHYTKLKKVGYSCFLYCRYAARFRYFHFKSKWCSQLV